MHVCLYGNPKKKPPPKTVWLDPSSTNLCILPINIYIYISLSLYMHLYFVVPFNIFDYRHEQVHELLLETHTNCSSKRMLLHTNERTNEQTNETRAKLPALGPALKIENQPAEPRRPGLLNLGSWLLGPVCIEVQFCNADCNGPWDQEPRFKSPGHLGSWSLRLYVLKFAFSAQISMHLCDTCATHSP